MKSGVEMNWSDGWTGLSVAVEGEGAGATPGDTPGGEESASDAIILSLRLEIRSWVIKAYSELYIYIC